VVQPATWTLAENAMPGASVGRVAVTDPDTGDTWTYALAAGNNGGAFALDPVTGELAVADSAALDFETTPSFQLTVRATDAGGAAGTATVTVLLTNMNEAPTMQPAAFNVSEHSPNGTLVGTVTATDPDVGDRRTFAISAGNAAGTFAIDPATGRVTVADNAALDLATTAGFQLTITGTDLAGLADSAVVTVRVSPAQPALFEALRGWPQTTPGTPQPGPDRSSAPQSGGSTDSAAVAARTEIGGPDEAAALPGVIPESTAAAHSAELVTQAGAATGSSPASRVSASVASTAMRSAVGVTTDVAARSASVAGAEADAHAVLDTRATEWSHVAIPARLRRHTPQSAEALVNAEVARTPDVASLWQQFDTLQQHLAEQARCHLGTLGVVTAVALVASTAYVFWTLQVGSWVGARLTAPLPTRLLQPRETAEKRGRTCPIPK
jgi:VCBS repeat-containing protein